MLSATYQLERSEARLLALELPQMALRETGMCCVVCAPAVSGIRGHDWSKSWSFRHRNQYVMKSSLPTSHQYVSPKSPKYKEVGTNFVKQHECQLLLAERRMPQTLTMCRDGYHGRDTVYHCSDRYDFYKILIAVDVTD